jgi:TetR/AcrR family transcriptional repressor of nem operon
MPRIRESSRLEGRLDKALKVFWEKGYYDTSIEDLSARSGLNRDVIYGGYGNKRKFFEMLLARYRDTYIAQWFAPLEMPDATLVQVEAFFQQFLDLPVPADKLGCLMCLTSSEVSSHIRSVERIVSRFLGDLHSLIRAACVRSRERGEVRPTTDPDVVADYGVGAVLGLWAMVRSPMPRSAIAHYVKGVRTYLRGLRPARGAGEIDGGV